MRNLIIGFGMICLFFNLIGCEEANREVKVPMHDSAGQSRRTLPKFDGTNQPKKYLSEDEFSKRWQSDTATNSFRSSVLEYDTSTQEIISVSGINFEKSSMSRIQYLLGKPDVQYTRGDSLTLAYFLAPHCGFSEEGCYRWVLEIKFNNGFVTDFYSSFIRTE